jgi:hypothetical protein
MTEDKAARGNSFSHLGQSSAGLAKFGYFAKSSFLWLDCSEIYRGSRQNYLTRHGSCGLYAGEKRAINFRAQGII